MKFRKQKNTENSNPGKKREKAKETIKHFFAVFSRPFVQVWRHSFLIQLIWHLTWLTMVIYMGQLTVAEYESSIYEATSFLTGKNKGYIALHYTNMITYSYNVLAILTAVLIVVCAKCIHKSFRKVYPKKDKN